MIKNHIFSIACGLLVAAIVVAVLLPVTVQTRTTYTCTLCRAERTDRTFFGFPSRSYKDTEFTKWFLVHRPRHDHQWGRLSCTAGRSILGTRTYFGCGPRHPVCDIPPMTLLRFAETTDSNTLAAYFEGITSTNKDMQRRTVQMAWDRVLEDR